MGMKAAKMLGIMLGILIIVHVAEAAEETQKGTGLGLLSGKRNVSRG
jgi:imidazoleglycerol phosphate synthase glutamine amidotransferase subunit HisH